MVVRIIFSLSTVAFILCDEMGETVSAKHWNIVFNDDYIEEIFLI